MREGIAFAGNLITDVIKTIDALPRRSEIVSIRSIRQSIGGVCNSAVSMALLDPDLPLSVYGVAGADGNGDYVLHELQRHGIRTDNVRRRGVTAFTDVFEETRSPARTMFPFCGANDTFDVDDIDYAGLTQKIFHVGYLLLLQALDTPDPDFGTRMGRMLHHAREAGCLTSVDVISEDTDRYRTIVRPTLPYVDLLIINETEASRITGIPLTDERGALLEENMPKALTRLFDMGVSTRAVIHSPAGAFGMDADGCCASAPSVRLPEGWIRGTVGAGDAFCSGALLATYREQSIEDALHAGHASAIQSLRSETSTGGMVPLEDALRVYQELRNGSESEESQTR